MAKTELFHNYCDAVERDPVAHPIQRAQRLIPPGAFRIAGELYDYTACPFHEDGAPLSKDEPVANAAWIIFDNVYIRTSGGRSPRNANRSLGLSVGFKDKGRGRDPERAAALWRSTVQMFGAPGATSIPSGSAPPAPLVARARSTARPTPALTVMQPSSPAPLISQRVPCAEGVEAIVTSALVGPRHAMAELGRPHSTVFYTNPWLTLTPGRYYLTGFKPGGDERVPSQDLAKLGRWPQSQPWSLYLDEHDWQSSNLQRNIQSFADAAFPGGRLQLRETFSTNAIFAHANDATVIAGIESQLFAICWPWHECFLDKVRPEVIITIGNGPQSAFNLFASRLNEPKTLGPDIPVYGTFGIRALNGWLSLTEPLQIRLVGLPHLSRCNVVSRPGAIAELARRGWL